MYLIDTNVWLEVLLDQEESETAGEMLSQLDSRLLSLTDFACHSIGVVLTRLDKIGDYEEFIDDTLVEHSVNICRVACEDSHGITLAIRGYGLDFDDAYQYVAATQNDLEIVSFDSDFDATDLGRLHPVEVLERLK